MHHSAAYPRLTAAAKPTRTLSKNRLLAGLTDGAQRRIVSRAEWITLKTGDVLNEPGDRQRFAIFPENGIISVVNLMQEGRSIEVATIGREGILGVPLLLGIDLVPFRHMVQVNGSALRITASELIEVARPGSPLSKLLLRYYVAFTAQIMQSVACAGLHSIEQRCCRWLLTTQDRVESPRFFLTHEFLALMLGTRRTSVTEVLKKLRDSGLIEYRRGMISILERAGLEARSCECYRTVAGMYRRIVG